MTAPSRRPLTIEQVTERTGVSGATLRYWRYLGTGPRSYKIGRQVVYDREEIDAWIERRKQETSVGGDDEFVARP